MQVQRCYLGLSSVSETSIYYLGLGSVSENSQTSIYSIIEKLHVVGHVAHL